MKTIFTALALIAIGTGSGAAADCYADYKAKQDAPLRLHYGVAQINGPCDDIEAASDELAPRLRADGWQLLAVMGLFDETGLAKRQDSAGDYYLRY